MKKIFCLCAVVSMCLLTGCTKNYKTVDEYETVLKEVRAKAPAYTVEVKQTLPMIEMYYRGYLKGDKWKTETSMNGGNSYATTTLYNGVDLLTYATGSPYAVSNPMLKYLSDQDEETKKIAIKTSNPINPLFDWTEGPVLTASLSNTNATFTNNKANKNGFECRLINFSDDREVCVSDKYGIAVYAKTKYENYKTKAIEEMQMNVVKIDTTDVPDTTFELPEGIKKQTLDNLFNNLSEMLKAYN